MSVSMKSLVSILLLVGIENLAPTQAMSLDSSHHNLIRLTRRRMNQEANLKSPVTEPCPGEICGVVGGKVIGARLAAAPNCARQDLADQLITDAKTSSLVKSDKLREQLIQWAKLICESEQNTHPNYQANPQTQRNFLYCLKAPKNKELEDCLPKQFEGNDPKIFFDPKVGDVALGSRPETFPRKKQPSGESATPAQNTSTTVTPPANETKTVDTSNTTTSTVNATKTQNVSTAATSPAVTTAATLQLLASTTDAEPKKEEPKKEEPKTEETKKEEPNKEEPNKEEPKKEEPNKEEPKKEEPNKEEPKKEEPTKEEPKKEEPNKEEPKKEEPNKEEPKKENPDQAAKTGPVDASKGKVVDASTLPATCNKPEVRYAAGLGGRKATEMSYEPVDSFYAHATALNFQIITDAICDKILACLKDAKKKEDEVQKIFKSCKDLSKAIGPIKKSGKAADEWNAGVSIFLLDSTKILSDRYPIILNPCFALTMQ
ncbi:hypothetical protein DFH28DRAFT_1223260 [Melampsora americana]|nr:hypothetical protein DFH28DRAFT_1223260 [Melampsora americana]